MSKHAYKTLTEQINNTGHGSFPFHDAPYQTSELIGSQDIRMKASQEHKAIQLRAYQIQHEKGGSAFDNWLEAEQILGNTDKAVSRLINEGDPNTQILKKV